MKYKIAILLVLLLSSCTVTRISPKMPVVITKKAYYYNEGSMAVYEFVDSVGNVFILDEGWNAHQIGDTLRNIYE